VMRGGRIEQLGTFDELYYTPANLYIAQFIGAPPIGVMPATIADRRVSIAAATWSLPDDLADELPPGPVRIGVRPDGWHLDAADGAVLPVRHIERIPTERSSFLFATLGGENIVIAAPLDYPQTGQIQVSPDWERVYVFAADSEETVRAPGVLELF
jgi:ABC-type sugar transport system ATPase subunit